MPMREFRCPQCGKVAEAFRSRLDQSPVLCDHDGKKVAMDRIEFSVPAKRNPKYGEQT